MSVKECWKVRCSNCVLTGGIAGTTATCFQCPDSPSLRGNIETNRRP